MRPLVEEALALPASVRSNVARRARQARVTDELVEDRFALSPMLISAERRAELDALGRAIHVVLNQSLDALRRRPSLLRRVAGSPRGWLAVARRHGFGQAQFAAFAAPTLLAIHRADSPSPIVRVRPDLLLAGGRLQIVEINVGTVPCQALDGLARAFETSAEMAQLTAGGDPARIADDLADALIQRHVQRFGAAPVRGAQTHHRDARSIDPDGLVEALERRGVEMLRAGPGDLGGDRRGLLCRGRPITLLSEECSAVPTTLSRFGPLARARHKLLRFAAMTAGTALVFPTPVTAVLNKAYLALLSEGALDAEIDGPSLRRLRDHLACTRQTIPGAATWRGERVSDLRRFALSERERLVLKPVVGNRSIGVRLGDRCAADEWALAVDRAFARRDSVLQERLRSEPVEVLLPDGSRAWAHTDAGPILIEGRTVAVQARFSVDDERLHFSTLARGRGASGIIPAWLAR